MPSLALFNVAQGFREFTFPFHFKIASLQICL
jgi:hypothetical protein